jgi:hypothetical protein
MAAGTREVWAKRVERWQASGLTVSQFARQHRLSETSLKWWKWKLGSARRAPATKAATPSPLTFVELAAPMQREALELVLASGAVVRVPADFDETALARLLDVLERRR